LESGETGRYPLNVKVEVRLGEVHPPNWLTKWQSWQDGTLAKSPGR